MPLPLQWILQIVIFDLYLFLVPSAILFIKKNHFISLYRWLICFNPNITYEEWVDQIQLPEFLKY
ncbi:hypothetical protein NIES2107_30890 [Nostoc carneum NIES-2107]|nr:hypothetical protein NIES2107_30890 [Nostoc carneum NIES-2107]